MKFRRGTYWAAAIFAMGLAAELRGQSAGSVVQQAYLKASNTGSFDGFSHAAISGDTLVVGASGESSAATGVNGNQNNNMATFSGAAYVFVRTDGAWTQQAYLKASNTDSGDGFGASVSISGDTVVVGAPFESSDATGVDGDQSDDSAQAAGAVYVFVRSGTEWVQQAYLKASNTGAGDHFGIAVAVSGDTLVVGAPEEDSMATGVGGDGLDDSAKASGAAYVFVRRGTSWTQQAYLKGSNAETFDNFGQSVSTSNDTVLIGAWRENSNATGVNGDETDNSAPGAGAAYVFVRSAGEWSQQAYLKASNTDSYDSFGIAVALSGNTAIVGAFGEASGASGVNGNQQLNGKDAAGAAYVFVRSGSEWSQQAYLKASNPDKLDQFGTSVALSGDTAAIGAPYEDSFSGGVDGDQSDNAGKDAGAAYAFTRVGSTWSQKVYLKAAHPNGSDLFGSPAVTVSGDTVVVGALAEASGATGVDGDQLDNSKPWSGAAYVFDLEKAWTDLGFSLPGAEGAPTLLGSGELTLDSTGFLTLRGAAPAARAVLFLSLTSTPTAFKGGLLVPVPVTWSVIGITSWQGAIDELFHWPDGIPSGTELYLQYAVRDVGAVEGFALSNALRAEVP